MIARFQEKREKDLFDQFQVSEKKIRKKTKILLPQLKKIINLSYENAIFFIIGLAMACIVCFSLGVEKGRQDIGLNNEPAEKEQKINKSVNQQISKPSDKYIIQLAAFRKKEPAENALAKLIQEGHAGNLKKSGDYYQLFIAGFEGKEDAEKLLKSLREKYKDCYIKKY